LRKRSRKDRDGILWFIGLTVLGSLASLGKACQFLSVKRLFPVAAMFVSLTVFGSDSQSGALTSAAAKALVMAALTAEQRHLPKIEAELDIASSSGRFLFYTVVWQGVPNGSVVVGSYAVDSQTGDVFSSTVSCDEQRNSRLEALQTRVRARLNLTQLEYKRRKTKGPLCQN
jgi:hypothetical protein